MKHDNLPTEELDQVMYIIANCLSRAGLNLTEPEKLTQLEKGQVGFTVNLTLPGREAGEIPALTLTGSLKELQQAISSEKNILRCDGLEVDCRRRRATLNGEALQLTPRELQLLTCLLQNRNQVLTRGQLLGSVWELGYAGDSRTVDTHVKCLRRKMGEFGRRHIITVRKAGYRFETYK